MSRTMWILAALLAGVAIATIYQSESGDLERPWAECKENLVTQMISGACTPRTGGLRAPANEEGAGSPAEPATDDGVTRVDRGN